MLKNIKINNKIAILALLLVSIPAALPIFHSGFYHFSDEPHFADLFQMIVALRSGQIPPRWAPDMSYGYGWPLFNFYYPLPFYLGSIVYFISNSLITSLKTVFLLTIPLSGIAMYLWLKEHASKLIALSGAIIYIYTPYRALDLYVRGALGECLAFVFIPLVALTIDKVIENRSYKFVGLMALTTGFFFVSHNLAPLIFIPWLFIYGAVRILSSDRKTAFTRLVAGFILGFAISAYWTIPAFLEKGLLASKTPFNYFDHFPFLKQLIYSPWRYGASLPGINDDMSFQIGIVNLVLVTLVLGFLLLKRISKKNSLALYLILTFFLSIFSMNIRSNFLWEIFPLSTYIQFPWRFLMITTFITSALVVFIKNPKVTIVLAILSILLTFRYFRPSEYFNPNDEYYLNRMFPYVETQPGVRISSTDYDNYSEDYLLLPIWTERRPSSVPSGKLMASPGLNLLTFEVISKVLYKADVSGNGRLTINNYYFPGWYAEVDGKPVDIKVLKPYGNIGIDIDSDLASVKIYWKETPLRLVMDVVSLLALGGSIFLAFKKDKYVKKK